MFRARADAVPAWTAVPSVLRANHDILTQRCDDSENRPSCCRCTGSSKQCIRVKRKKEGDQRRVGVKARETLVSFCGCSPPPHTEDAVDVTERPADGVHVQRPLQQ